MSEENSKCGPGTHYDEETNSCILDEKVDEPVQDEKEDDTTVNETVEAETEK